MISGHGDEEITKLTSALNSTFPDTRRIQNQRSQNWSEPIFLSLYDSQELS